MTLAKMKLSLLGNAPLRCGTWLGLIGINKITVCQYASTRHYTHHPLPSLAASSAVWEESCTSTFQRREGSNYSVILEVSVRENFHRSEKRIPRETRISHDPIRELSRFNGASLQTQHMYRLSYSFYIVG